MALDRLDAQSRSPDYLKVSNVKIVSLSPDQWTVLRDLKLRSLDQEPLAFADPGEERAKYLARTEEEWRAILSGKMSGGREGQTLMVFAQDNGRYIGMVSAIIPANQPPDGKTATIQHMFVDNEGYRGLGIGKKLLSALLEKLRNRGDIKKAELEVLATQLPAQKLYEGLGFKEIGDKRNSVQRSGKWYDEIKMELTL